MKRQTDKKRINRKIIYAYLAFFLVLVISWISLYAYCCSKSNSEHSYTFSEREMDVSKDGLVMTIDVSKSWKDSVYHGEIPYGGQYDATIRNNSNYNFINLSAELEFDGPLLYDDGWNGDYSIENNRLQFTATSPADVVPAKGEQTFGAILYTHNNCNVVGYTVTGYWDVDIRDTGWFWILLELSIMFFLTGLLYIFYLIKTANLERLVEHDAQIIEQSMKTLTGFIDAKDAYTKDHSARVAEYSKEIGRRIGMDEEEVKSLYYITLLHDCGKVGIPDDILKKKGALTPDEFAIVKTHTTRGNELLKKFTSLEGIGDGAHYHHERYDGYGYPTGLEGEEIPLVARIISVADAYDAMSSNRCYRDALGKEKILSELKLNSGKQFDPKFATVMIAMIEDGFVDTVKEKYPSE